MFLYKNIFAFEQLFSFIRICLFSVLTITDVNQGCLNLN